MSMGIAMGRYRLAIEQIIRQKISLERTVPDPEDEKECS